MKKPFSAYNGSEKFIFVSYAHKDAADVYPLIDALGAQGCRIWYDEGIGAGEDWAEKIGKRLEEATCVLLFLSEGSSASKNCQREINYARQNGKKIYVAELEKLKSKDSELERFINVNQNLKLYDFRNYSDFVSAILPPLRSEGVCGNERRQFKDRRISLRKKQKRRKRWAIFAAGLLLFAVLYKSLVAFVPNVIGFSSANAEEKVAGNGFKVSIAMDYSEEEDYGYIVDQTKYADTLRFMPVVLTQSLGSADSLTIVPELVGFHLTEGVRKLVDADILSFTVRPVISSEYAESFIVSQSIPSGLKVSSKNNILLEVSGSESYISFDYAGKQYRIPTDNQYRVDVDGKWLKISKLRNFNINFDYSETDPLNINGSVSADLGISLDSDFTGLDPFGRYHGNMISKCSVYGNGNVSGAWKLLLSTLGDENGRINMRAVSDSFEFTLEKFDEVAYNDFVNLHTGGAGSKLKFSNPVGMSLNEGVALTNEGVSMKLIKAFLKGAPLFAIDLPGINGAELSQPFVIVVEQGGRIYLSLLSDRSLSIHDEIRITDVKNED